MSDGAFIPGMFVNFFMIPDTSPEAPFFTLPAIAWPILPSRFGFLPTVLSLDDANFLGGDLLVPFAALAPLLAFGALSGDALLVSSWAGLATSRGVSAMLLSRELVIVCSLPVFYFSALVFGSIFFLNLLPTIESGLRKAFPAAACFYWAALSALAFAAFSSVSCLVNSSYFCSSISLYLADSSCLAASLYLPNTSSII